MNDDNRDEAGQEGNVDSQIRQLGHDLRGCLSTIHMATEILRQAGDDPGRREKVISMLDRQVRHAGGLLDELVAVAQSSAKASRTDRDDNG